jgi:hypothetical protein
MLIRKYNIGPTLTDILSASGAAQGALPGLLELLVSFRLQKPGLMEVNLYSCELCRLTDMGKQWFLVAATGECDDHYADGKYYDSPPLRQLSDRRVHGVQGARRQHVDVRFAA